MRPPCPLLDERCRSLDAPLVLWHASKRFESTLRSTSRESHVSATQGAHTAAVPRSRLAFAKRIDDLLSRLTLDEKMGCLHQFTPAVERLGIAAFHSGQESLHRVAWMGQATVLAQAVGLGATWNTDLVRWADEAVSTEIRAMRARDDRVGLNLRSPKRRTVTVAPPTVRRLRTGAPHLGQVVGRQRCERLQAQVAGVFRQPGIRRLRLDGDEAGAAVCTGGKPA